MPVTPKNVLILCTGNSARSLIGESILNHDTGGRFRGFSAGSNPTGQPNPFAITLLEKLGHDTSGLRSKNWAEFSGPAAPKMDFVFTVCGNAAGETCPIWPGHPASAHWGTPDPAAATGSDKDIAAAFEDAHRRLAARITAFCALPLDDLDAATLRSKLQAIGDMQDS